MRTARLAYIVAVLLALAGGPLACKTAEPEPPSSSAAAEKTCATCHANHVVQWQDGGHRQIACGTCHAAAAAHALAAADQPRPRMPPTRGAQACLACHSQLKSFEAHVKVVEARHVVKASERANGQCVYCHDPHSLQ